MSEARYQKSMWLTKDDIDKLDRIGGSVISIFRRGLEVCELEMDKAPMVGKGQKAIEKK